MQRHVREPVLCIINEQLLTKRQCWQNLFLYWFFIIESLICIQFKMIISTTISPPNSFIYCLQIDPTPRFLSFFFQLDLSLSQQSRRVSVKWLLKCFPKSCGTQVLVTSTSDFSYTLAPLVLQELEAKRACCNCQESNKKVRSFAVLL